MQPGTLLWQQFEKDVADQIVAKYVDVTVEHNVEVNGCESGRLRQIDVLVCGRTAGTTIKLAIECKRNATRQIGIGKVDEFIGKLHDLDIQVGIMYAFGGFDSGAKARAAGARHPKVELRDRNHIEASTPVPPKVLFDWHDACGHMDELVHWQTITDEGSGTELQIGVCGYCGTSLGKCPDCESVTELDADTDCDGWCGARWEVGYDRDHLPVFNWVAPLEEPTG